MRHPPSAPRLARLARLCRLSALMLSVSFASLTGCSIYSMTGDTMSGYTKEHLAPYVLGTSDLDMACEMGASMGPFLLSFERVTSSPDEAAIPTLLTAALCAEREVWREELRAARAFKEQRVAEYKDALTAQKRAHGLAASRYARAYQRLERLYPKERFEGGSCPELDEHQELLSVMGMIAGVQAVQHDRASGVMVGVPTNTPVKVIARAKCFDEGANKRWWGVPRALEAAIWLVVPGTGPGEGSEQVKANAYKALEASVKLGQEAGVRLADSVFAYAAEAVGDVPKVKALISAFAQARQSTPSAPRWALLDETSALQLLALSDRLWTKEKGHRTPAGRFGEFWEEPEAEEATEGEAEGEDDLLDAL